MKKTVIRDNSSVKNVDFTRLNKILNEKGIRRAELSRRCGYYPYYVKDHVFKEKKLNWTVANMLEKVYGISPDEYCYEKTETTDSDDDIYKCVFLCNGDFFKKVALASIKEHMSIEDFVFECILKGLKQEEN